MALRKDQRAEGGAVMITRDQLPVEQRDLLDLLCESGGGLIVSQSSPAAKGLYRKGLARVVRGVRDYGSQVTTDALIEITDEGREVARS